MAKKMKFAEDKYYNRDIIYVADKVYEVPDNMVDRWLKRGGIIVAEEKPVVVAPKKEETKPAYVKKASK